MASVSSIGVGSGLPLDELLTNLRKSENVALTQISNQKKLAENRLSAYGVLRSSLDNLAKAAADLGKAETFNATKTSVAGDAFTATGKSGAIAGRYDIEVTQLASTQSLVSQTGVASRITQIGGEGAGGVLNFVVNGETKTLDLADKGNSINDILKAINASDLGVQATVINDGSANPLRLMLTTKESGSAAAITSISVEGNDDLQAVLGYNSTVNGTSGGMQQNIAAADAQLTVNGIPITSKTNNVDNVIDGVSLTLSKTTGGTAQSLTVEPNPSVTQDAIKKFVDAYNALQTNINNLTSYDQTTKTSSALTGDSVARAVQSRARGIIDISMSGNQFSNLTQLGITTNPTDGKLQIDEEKLTAALRNNGDAVANLFTGENGLAARADSITKPMLETERGLIAISEEGAKRMADSLGKEYERTELRIEATMERYRAQFVALDSMMSQMNGISTYLTQQLSMLGNNSNK